MIGGAGDGAEGLRMVQAAGAWAAPSHCDKPGNAIKRPACRSSRRRLARRHRRTRRQCAGRQADARGTQLLVLNVCRPQACNFLRVIPAIDIWRAANLMLKRYGNKALEESSTRADELAAAGDQY